MDIFREIKCIETEQEEETYFEKGENKRRIRWIVMDEIQCDVAERRVRNACDGSEHNEKEGVVRRTFLEHIWLVRIAWNSMIFLYLASLFFGRKKPDS